MLGEVKSHRVVNVGKRGLAAGLSGVAAVLIGVGKVYLVLLCMAFWWAFFPAVLIWERGLGRRLPDWV